MLLDLFYLDRPIWDGDFTTFAVAMPAAVGLFTLTGQDADMLANHILTADQGSFTFNGQAITFGVAMPAAVGSFAVNGQDITFGVSMPAATGSFTLTGKDVTFTVGGGEEVIVSHVKNITLIHHRRRRR